MVPQGWFQDEGSSWALSRNGRRIAMNTNIRRSAPRTDDVRSAPDRGAEPQDQTLVPDGPPQHDQAAQAPRKSLRGFAAMDRKLVSEIASKGGKAAHARGTAHQFTSEEAREAGRKGGHASHAKRRSTLERP
jgi:uncharacterized protein